MNPQEPRTYPVHIGKFITALVLGWYFILYATSDPSHSLANWNFIDNVDLIIHEAGHTVFIFFGEFLRILGGSFLQIALPIVFAGYFFLRRQPFSASVILLWVGQNIINVATYLGDAIVQQLSLLGGDGVMHDWNYLLGEMGLLRWTDSIANLLHGVGVVTIIVAVVLCIFFSLNESVRGRVVGFYR